MTPEPTMTNREQHVPPRTERQHTVVTLVTRYYAAADEYPTSGWLARKLSISRQTAYRHLQTMRSRGWLESHRTR
jgi:hypothetical protein